MLCSHSTAGTHFRTRSELPSCARGSHITACSGRRNKSRPNLAKWLSEPVSWGHCVKTMIFWNLGCLDREKDFDMYDIPETGFLRLPQVLSVIPLGKTCWWEGVRSGRFPKPVKLSERCTAWRAEDIHELIRTLSNPTPTN
jgi:predicted DNA-binding transcriptional regulator AlpA